MEPHDPEEFDRTLAPASMLPWILLPGRSRIKRWAQIAASFLLGQGATQLITVASGLFLVHRLSIESYAQFGLATGFQNVFAVLMDFGFASTIVPLVAARRDDKTVVGRYVRAANHLRNRSFLVLAPVAAVCFLGITYRHHWSLGVQLLLLASVLLSLYSGGTLSYFSAPLLLFGKLEDYYVPQFIFGLCRLAAYVLLAVTLHLSSWTAAGLAALAVTASAWSIRKRSAPLLNWPAEDSPEIDREVVSYILPAAPAIIFAAFQPQISLFLVSIFGGTLYIAQVAALARLAQMFTMLMSFATIVIEPYIARLERARLLRVFISVVVLTCVAIAPVVFMAFRYPGVFIWIIGSKYEGLRGLLGWYILSLSLNLVSGFVWIMNRGRKWVFWRGSVLEIVLLVVVQVGYLALVGVRNTEQAVFFSFGASFCYMVAHGYVAIYGFVHGAPEKDAELQSADSA